MNKDDSTKHKNGIISGLIWTYAERITAQGVSLLVTILLARMIAPEDFGAIAIITIFINIANTLATEGLGTALIQKKEVDDIDFSTVFSFNLFTSILLYFLIYLSAPYIASFYKITILTPALRVMGIRIILAGINSVQQAYISRNMEFKKFFISTLFGTGFSAIAGILMAFNGFGIWALIVQYLSNTIIDTVILYFTSGLKLKFIYRRNRMKVLFKYGWKLVASSLMISFYSNIRDLIIGKKYSSADLAFCNKGNQFPSLISVNINTSLTKVLFPALSSYQNDIIHLKRMTRSAISLGTFVLSPILIGLAATAEPFIKILLTDKWLPCVPYLRIYCFIFLLQPIQTASLQAMKAMGKSDLYLKLEIIKKVFGIIILVSSILYFNGVIYIVLGALVAEIFSSLVNIPINKKLLKYTYIEQIKDAFPSTLLAASMGVIVYIIGVVFSEIYFVMFLEIIIGIIYYILGSKLLKFKEYEYLKSFIDNYRNRLPL